MLLGRFHFFFFKGKKSRSLKKMRKKIHKVSIRLYWGGLALHPCVDFAKLPSHLPILCGSCQASQRNDSGADQQTSPQCAGKESTGEKTGVLASFVLFQGQDKNRDVPWSPCPSLPCGPRTMEYARPELEVSAEPQLPGFSEE